MYAALALAFASVAAALPAPQPGSTEPLRLGGLAQRTGSPIHLSSINANEGRFVIGKNTTTYVPEGVEGVDPAHFTNNQTIFTYLYGEGTVNLDTSVPGGQQIYVTEGDEATGELAGQLKFTPAHSAQTSGPALFNGFAIVYDATLQFENQDWFACPLDDFNSGYSVWSAARLEGSNAGEDCLSFVWRLIQIDADTPPAWQYI